MRKDWESIGEIENVGRFTTDGSGPFVDKIAVIVNQDPSPNYPSNRVYLGTFKGEAVCLTFEQAMRLSSLLDRAAAAIPPEVRKL